MAVYVDELFNTQSLKNANWKYNQACHLKADTEEELHAFAEQLGLKREWFQDHINPAYKHYDLTASKRVIAIQRGAIPLTWREMVKKTNEMRESVNRKAIIAKITYGHFHEMQWFCNSIECAPTGADDFTLDDTTKHIDDDGVPEALRRSCLECGMKIVRSKTMSDAIYDLTEKAQKQGQH